MNIFKALGEDHDIQGGLLDRHVGTSGDSGTSISSKKVWPRSTGNTWPKNASIVKGLGRKGINTFTH